jgi:tRNA1(Val) A37 N6-methylase TrmN6
VPTSKILYLYQKEDGYKYNSDTLALYDFILKFNPKKSVLDVGSGSGILGLLLKRDCDIELTSIDIQKTNQTLTYKNADKNSLHVEAYCGDFLKFDFNKKFDFIVSNPPFYHEGSQKSENKTLSISRYASFLPFEDFAKKVSSIISPRGNFIFCYDAKQIDLILSLLLKYRLKPIEIKFVHTKKDKDAKLVLICAKKSSKSLCKILPPLYMDSDQMKKIYEKSKTKSIEC